MEEKNVFDFQEFKKNYKWTHFKAGVRDKALEAKAWYKDHREECLILIPAAIGGVGAITRFASKRLNARSEKIHKDREFYDHSLGKWVIAKRKPSKKEMDLIMQRKAGNENYYTILKDMNLL